MNDFCPYVCVQDCLPFRRHAPSGTTLRARVLEDIFFHIVVRDLEILMSTVEQRRAERGTQHESFTGLVTLY